MKRNIFIVLTILCFPGIKLRAFEISNGMDFSRDIFELNNSQEIEQFISSVQNFEQVKFPNIYANNDSKSTSKPNILRSRRRRKRKKKIIKVNEAKSEEQISRGNITPRLRIPRTEMKKIRNFIENVCKTSEERISLDKCKIRRRIRERERRKHNQYIRPFPLLFFPLLKMMG